MTTTKKLYGWDVDRDGRFACAATSPYDDAGNDLILFNGMALDESVMINLEKPAGVVIARGRAAAAGLHQVLVGVGRAALGHGRGARPGRVGMPPPRREPRVPAVLMDRRV